MPALLIIYTLITAACAFGQPQPPVFVDRYETAIGRITINCDAWTDEYKRDWLAALEDVKLTSGLILDLRGVTGTAESRIPELLGYFFDEQTMEPADAALYREFLNGVVPYTKPLLIQHSETAVGYVLDAIELLKLSRTYVETTTCDLDCKMSRKPLRRFKREVHTEELDAQERMDWMFEGAPDTQPVPTATTPEPEPVQK